MAQVWVVRDRFDLESWFVAVTRQRLVQLLKSYIHNGLKPPFYYYRDKDKKEIDLLIVKDGTIYPLEFKKTATPNKNDLQHFQALDNLKMPIGDGGIICLVKQLMPITSKIMAIPIGAV